MRFKFGNQKVFVSTGSNPIRPEANTITFIHGAGHDHSVWTLFSRFFARKGYNTITVDLPGHGETDGPPLSSISDMANWTASVVKHLNIEKSIFVGHSMGSLVAAQLANDRPVLCQSVAMLGMSIPMPVSDALLSAAADGDHAAIDMANYWSHSKQSDSRNNPGVWKLGLNNRVMERNGIETFYSDLQACNSFSSAITLNMPSLLILGELDQMTPFKSGRQVAEALRSQLVRIDGAGHAMLTERPNEVLDALRDFVDS